MDLNIAQLRISSWKSIMQHCVFGKWIRWYLRAFKVWSLWLFVAHFGSIHKCWLVQWSQITHILIDISSFIFTCRLYELPLIDIICCHVCALSTHIRVSEMFILHLKIQWASVAEWLCYWRRWIYAIVASSSLISPVMLCCVWFRIDLNFVEDLNISCKITRVRRIGDFVQIHIALYFNFEFLWVIRIVQAHLILIVKIVPHWSHTWFWVNEDNILFLSFGIGLQRVLQHWGRRGIVLGCIVDLERRCQFLTVLQDWPWCLYWIFLIKTNPIGLNSLLIIHWRLGHSILNGKPGHLDDRLVRVVWLRIHVQARSQRRFMLFGYSWFLHDSRRIVMLL
jgi:hypothetical protein